MIWKKLETEITVKIRKEGTGQIMLIKLLS